jgi:hypothetical protein
MAVVVDAEDGAGAMIEVDVGGLGVGWKCDFYLGLTSDIFIMILYLLSCERGYRHQLDNQTDDRLCGTSVGRKVASQPSLACRTIEE